LTFHRFLSAPGRRIGERLSNMARRRGVFDLFSKPVRAIVDERGFPSPTGPQVAAIPKILNGMNVLLIAPTGTGKTEAAFLPILDLYIKEPVKPLGIKILYITPLRALNRDLLGRLEWWCQRLDIKVSVRHGDTDVRERTAQSRSPPDLLITTPETLQAIIPGRVMRRHLRAVKWVIIDECHELAEDKRGSQLSLALERLRWITGRDFQVVGLSATIGSPQEVAQFIVGNNRTVDVVRVPVARGMDLSIVYPEPIAADYELAERLYTHPEVAARLRVMREVIEKHQSVLLFTNTRPAAEVLASRLRIWDAEFPVSIHHGSLAKPARVSAERGLKTGELRGLICTSSLELGIDVGRIDLCIQYMSPRQVTRLLQRVGRSGHQIGRIAKGVIVTMDPDDTLEAMVIARRAKRERLEPVTIPVRPYDALNHQLVGLLVQKSRWYFDEILDVYGKAYPYRGMDKEDLTKVLTYMYTRYPRLAWVSFQDEVMLRPARIKPLYEYYFDKLSMIPDEKQYLVIDETDDSPVGILDEAFVAEYGEPGTKFIVRGSPWKMLSIVGDKIYVRPITDPTGAIPSWVGEEIPVPLDVAMEVGSIRGSVAAGIARGVEPKVLAQRICSKYPVDEDTALRAIKDVVDQAEQKLPVPSDRLITVEEWEEYIIVQVSFGSLVNRTLARLLGHLLSERTGHTVGVQQDAYRIILQVAEVAKAKDAADILEELPNHDVAKVAIQAAEKTGLFKRRMVHVARRFGALSRRADFSKVSLDRLERSFEGTVIHEEAVKETSEKDMDIANTLKVLEAMRKGKVRVVVLSGRAGVTPVARVGLERISRRSDLIPAEKMRHVLIQSAKARILSDYRTFLCVECFKHAKTIRLKDLPERPTCPVCGGNALAVLNRTEEQVWRLVEKHGRNLSRLELRTEEDAKASSELVKKYGSPAAYALAGRRLGASEAAEILGKGSEVNDRFFEHIVDAERRATSKRFW